MGSEAVVAPLTELNVKIDEPEYVKPVEPCENTSPFFLTNADQVIPQNDERFIKKSL